MGTDIDVTLLSKIERGERLPTTEQLKRLAKYFKSSEHDLMANLISERIIKAHGINELTYDAIQLAEKKIASCLRGDTKIYEEKA